MYIAVGSNISVSNIRDGLINLGEFNDLTYVAWTIIIR